MPATITDVARRAGVDKRTVSRVTNHQRYVSAAVRARVEQAIAELDYAPNSAAQRLRFQRTFTIAVAFGGSAADFIAASILSITRVAAGQGYTVIVLQFDPEDPASLAGVADLARRRQADGLIVTGPPDILETQLAPLLPPGFPWVHFTRSPTPRAFPSVYLQSPAGAYALTEHLLSLGHRRIGYVSAPAIYFADRLHGFYAAMADRQVAVDPRHVLVLEEPSFLGGFAAGRALLAVDPPPTALCTCHDALAAGIMAAARELGVRVPEDLSVAGFADYPIAQMTLPALTTVQLPFDEVSQRATEMLVSLINGETLKELHVGVPVRVVVRGSTGEPACEWNSQADTQSLPRQTG